MKAILKREFITMSACIRKSRRSQMYNLMMHHKTLEKGRKNEFYYVKFAQKLMCETMQEILELKWLGYESLNLISALILLDGLTGW